MEAFTRLPQSSKKRDLDGEIIQKEFITFPRPSSLDGFVEMLDSIDVVEIFHCARDMNDQFVRLYKLPFLEDYVPSIGHVGKDPEHARRCLLDGKVAQDNKDLENSLEKFNDVIRFAEPWSLELGTAYYERSTTLFHMGEYELSRKDGVRALKYCLADEAKEAILRRQVACRDALEEAGFERDVTRIRTRLEAMKKSLGEPWNDKDTLVNVYNAWQSAPRSVTPAARKKNQGDPRLPRMLCRRNLQIPATADNLKLLYTETQGRHYVANRRIFPGEVVTIENPLASALYTDCWKTHCYNCHRRTLAGIPCSTCSLVVFCGEHCKEAAMKYHEFECNHMVELYDLGDHDGVLLAYKMILQHPIEELLMWRPYIENPSQVVSTRNEDTTNSLLVGNELGSSLDLLSHHADTNPFYTLKACKIAVFLVKCLEQTSYFGEYDSEDVRMFLGKLLYRYLLVVVCNYFTSSEVVMQQGPPFRVRNGPSFIVSTPAIAMNLYCAGSYFNHSCAPNITHYFVNGRLVCRAHQIIEPGESVCISYGASAHSESISDRRRFLFNGFHFKCKCPACVGAWAPLRQLLLAYKGSDINYAALGFQDDTETVSTTEETTSTDDSDDSGETASTEDENKAKKRDAESSDGLIETGSTEFVVTPDDFEIEGAQLISTVCNEKISMQQSMQQAVAEIQNQIAKAEEFLKKSEFPTSKKVEPTKDDKFAAILTMEDKHGREGTFECSMEKVDDAKLKGGYCTLKDDPKVSFKYTIEEELEMAKKEIQAVSSKVSPADKVGTSKEEILGSLIALEKKKEVLKALLMEKERELVGKVAIEHDRAVGGTAERPFKKKTLADLDPEFVAKMGDRLDLKDFVVDSDEVDEAGSDDSVSNTASTEDPEAAARAQWTRKAITSLPMWPKHSDTTEDDVSSDESSDNRTVNVVSGGYRCPKCQHVLKELNVSNLTGLKDKKCPACGIEFKPFIEKYTKARDTSEEIRMLVEGGHFGRIHDAIESTGVYIQMLQSFALFPNLELLSTIVHLAHFFLMETVV